MRLTLEASRVAQELLDWDLRRVAKLFNEGHDVSVLIDRQQVAQAAISANLPAEDWPRTILDMFQALLEISMVKQNVVQYAVGPTRNRPEVAPHRLRLLARELGVIGALREVAPLHWREETR